MKSRPDLSISVISLICCLAVASAAIFLAVAGGRSYLGGCDYRVYLTAGKMALHGTGANFYDLPTQFAEQRELWPEMTAQKQLLPFLAPPFVALLFAPLAALPVLPGYVIWTGLNTLLLWFIVCGLLEVVDLHGSKRLVAVGLMLTFAPVLFTVMQGQVSFLVVLAWLQSYRAAKLGRDFNAGLWLALLLIRPQLALFPLLIFVCKGRWKTCLGFALGAAFVAGASLTLVGWEGLGRYKNLLGAVSGWQGVYGVQPQQMQTWRGFLHALLGTNAADAVRWPWLLGVAAALGVLGWSWRGAWKPQAPRFERQYALLILVALFCCPYLYSHDLSSLVVGGALLFRAAQIEKTKLAAWPIVGYAAVLGWAALLGVRPPVPSLAVLFEAITILMLGWSDRRFALGAGAEAEPLPERESAF